MIRSENKHLFLINQNQIIFSQDIEEQIIIEVSDLSDIEVVVSKQSKINVIFVINTLELHIKWKIESYSEMSNVLISKNITVLEEEIHVHKNGILNIYQLFTEEKPLSFKQKSFLKDNSVYEYHGSVISKGVGKKTLDFIVNNQGRDIYSDVQVHGVALKRGFVGLNCNNVIDKGNDDVSTHQTLKVILLDEKSKGKVDPVLTINHNNVKASHSAAIGQVSNENLFYLMSRGLNKEETHKIIILGYFRPILEKITNEEIVNELEESLNKKIFL